MCYDSSQHSSSSQFYLLFFIDSLCLSLEMTSVKIGISNVLRNDIAGENGISNMIILVPYLLKVMLKYFLFKKITVHYLSMFASVLTEFNLLKCDA